MHGRIVHVLAGAGNREVLRHRQLLYPLRGDDEARGEEDCYSVPFCPEVKDHVHPTREDFLFIISGEPGHAVLTAVLIHLSVLQ